MEERELKMLREKPQTITNKTWEDFYYKWDGKEYLLKKGATDTLAFYLAEHAALKMARELCTKKWANFHKEGGMIVDEIMGKEFIDYDKLSISQAKELCKERDISLKNEEDKPKNRLALIQDLKNSH